MFIIKLICLFSVFLGQYPKRLIRQMVKTNYPGSADPTGGLFRYSVSRRKKRWPYAAHMV